MLQMLRNAAKTAINHTGFAVVRATPNSNAYLVNRLTGLGAHLFGLDPETRAFLTFCVDRIETSKSQIMQDLFVLFILREKRNGYFVDFGATDGVELSNSLLLETGYDWNGIVAEPARGLHDQIAANRNCSIEYDCVAERSGETVMFNETVGLGLSTIESFTDSDSNSEARVNGDRYEVKTISLNDLLERHNSPTKIDYLSIDTEGSEYSILSMFDFENYQPAVVTVEHNFVDAKRLKLFELLSSHGYKRRFETLSMFDDWYVHPRAM